MKDKVCLVTGANTGIGRETARGLAQQGATVVMAARNRAKGEEAVADIKASTGNDKVELLELDLASLSSVREAAKTFLASHDRLDLLVNNAGLILGDRRTTEDGFESTFGINHLGHFELTRLLLDTIKRSKPARIVNVASDAHRASKGLDFDDLMVERRPYKGIGVYADSKLANILFTRELARRLEGSGVITHAVHPGVVRSGFARDGDVKGVLGFLVKVFGPFLLSPADGAATSLHVSLSEDASTSTGEYWARSKRREPRKPALDDAAAKRLWQVSEKLIDGAALDRTG
ncbi:MAG: SDR family oxidoreductase [Nannocystaceae bacterium]|nr:SDR family oxidoreductase [Nannocystaceae bacterium]